LCTSRILSLFDKVKPLIYLLEITNNILKYLSKQTSGSNAWENSLNSLNVEPSLRSSWVQFNNTDTIACVAQAFVITYQNK